MAVWGSASFKGGPGKSAIITLIAHVLSQAGYSVTVIDGGTNPDQGSRSRVNLAKVPMRVPTLEKDTYPAQWWTNPTTGFQLLPGAEFPEFRSIERITADVERALRRLGASRDFVFVDLPQTDSHRMDAMFGLLDFVIVVVNQTASSIEHTKAGLEYWTRTKDGFRLDPTQVRLCYTATSSAVKDGYNKAKYVLDPYPILGHVAWDPEIELGGNAGELVNRASPATMQAVRAFARDVFGVAIPEPVQRKRWRRKRVEQPLVRPVPPQRPSSAVPPAGPLSPDPTRTPSSTAPPPPPPPRSTGDGRVPPPPPPLFLPGGPAVPAGPSVGLSGQVLTVEPDAVAPSMPALDHVDRPVRLLRVFTEIPSIDPSVGMTPTALQAMFVLEAAGGSRRMDTVAMTLSLGDSRQATKTERTLGTLFKTEPGGLVVKSNKTLVLAPGVMSDYRWIALLAEVIGRNGSTASEMRWQAMSEVLAEAAKATAPAYGAGVGFGWADTPETVPSPAGEATRILIDALSTVGTGWCELAATEYTPLIPGVLVVRMLLKVQTLFEPDDALPLLNQAAHVAAQSGDSARFQVQHAVRLRQSAGWEPPTDLLDLIGV